MIRPSLPIRHRTTLPLAIAALLAGCSVKTHDANGSETATIGFGGDGGNASAGDAASGGDKTVSVNIPGFHAKVALPEIDLSDKDTDIDGIALYPGTKMTGVDVNADAHSGDGRDGGSGHVAMAFSAPATPDQLLAYYKGAARDAGWQERPPAAGQRFAATKPDDGGKTKRLAIILAAAGAGATGRFLIDGD